MIPLNQARTGTVGTGAGYQGGSGSGAGYISPTGAVSTPSGSTYGGYNTPGQGAGTGSIGQYGYTPEGMASIYGEPAILAQDILMAMGINNPGLAQSLADYFGPALAAHFLQSGGGLGSSGGDAASLSGVNDYLTQYVTPNGQVAGFEELMQMLLAGASDPNSPIATYLGSNPGSTLDTAGQMSNVNNLIGQSTAGLNPYAQEMYGNFIDDQSLGYQSGLAKGAPGGSSYADYIAKSNLPRWLGAR